jgi:hypothetical protein
MKAALYTLIPALFLAFSSTAAADILSTYGDVVLVTNGPPGNTLAWKITSDPAGIGYGGLIVQIMGSLTPATLTNLIAEYVMLEGTFGCGAPRFTLFDNTSNPNNAAYLYWGTPVGGGVFTDPNLGSPNFASTGNYANLASLDLRVYSNGFGGDNDPNVGVTWATFVSLAGTTPISYITLDLDGSGCGLTQQMLVEDFAINSELFGSSVSVSYEIGYAANLNIGDSVVNLSNDGSQSTDGTTGNLCVNVYTFDAQEEEISCCFCLVTPDGLNSLSAKADLISNVLTPAIPNSIVIKLLATMPATDASGNFTICNAATAGSATGLSSGTLAWGTTLEPAASLGTYGPVNVPFINGTLSGSEANALAQTCGFIQSDGTGYGTCASCATGGLGGAKK